MRLVVYWSVLVGCGVLSLPHGDWNQNTTNEPTLSTSRPKRDDAQTLCSGHLTNKRDAPCCGAESPKQCCGAGADPSCCGQKAETIKSKRDAADSTNDTLCCGKNRLVRAPASTKVTAKPTSPIPPSGMSTLTPPLTPTRVVRQDNKSCCGADADTAAQEKPKRSTGVASCCGGAASQGANSPSDSDKSKGRLVRETCCGLQGDNTKKCCGVEAPSAPVKRCIHATTIRQE